MMKITPVQVPTYSRRTNCPWERIVRGNEWRVGTNGAWERIVRRNEWCAGTNCPWERMARGCELSVGTNCPWERMVTWERIVHGDEFSMGTNCPGTSSPWGRIIRGRVVLQPFRAQIYHLQIAERSLPFLPLYAYLFPQQTEV
jgi:hypothetical protein